MFIEFGIVVWFFNHHKKSPLEAIKDQAMKEEVLVPIRIECEHEGYKLRDTFTWNLNGMIHKPKNDLLV